MGADDVEPLGTEACTAAYADSRQGSLLVEGAKKPYKIKLDKRPR